ncbi:MAG TPA: hypothetical protein VGO04_13635 [Ensifer sp.]|jgi:hypothetical protein|uniref:hypothetical protein n=1 Tax=Ensifer sp. TaxID=1872086 RepID=UPI002E11DD57|nr:hypothetical protein [Ensifer sp.]
MAVLHHAFRCPVTPAFKEGVQDVLSAWEAGDRKTLSAIALARYGALGEREDLHAAFHLGPDAAAPSWLQPQFISPGLATLVVLAAHFVPLPSLSASNDTNHHRLATQLPTLGWTTDETDTLIHGQPIEAMLQDYADPAVRPTQGGFGHTGGWTAGRIGRTLAPRLDQLAFGPPPQADEAAQEAWRQLNETDALDDARAMLAEVRDDDWLVMAITH